MSTKSEIIKSMWKVSRHNLNRLLPSITSDKLSYKLHPDSNSLGFLLLHIAEVEIMFGNSVFSFNYNIEPKTFKKDNDFNYNNLEYITELINKANLLMEGAIDQCKEDEWDDIVKTPIGEFKRFDSVARIITHSSYHTGQIGLINKYGK